MPVFDLATDLGLARRIGLEDVQTDRTGQPVQDNATLIRAALRN
ncbi:hypothetical protein [Streptacidiphilus sp. PAMC 29251]